MSELRILIKALKIQRLTRIQALVSGCRSPIKTRKSMKILRILTRFGFKRSKTR